MGSLFVLIVSLNAPLFKSKIDKVESLKPISIEFESLFKKVEQVGIGKEIELKFPPPCPRDLDIINQLSESKKD